MTEDKDVRIVHRELNPEQKDAFTKQDLICNKVAEYHKSSQAGSLREFATWLDRTYGDKVVEIMRPSVFVLIFKFVDDSIFSLEFMENGGEQSRVGMWIPEDISTVTKH